MTSLPRRAASLERTTRETTTRGSLDLAAGGTVEIATGIGFLDHMLTALATHGGFSLTLQCAGDLHIDDHHTAEDCAIVLGRMVDAALADRNGLTRFGYAYAPLDESLARSVIDLVARPNACINLSLQREALGTIATENVTHFLRTMAMEGRFTLHVDVLRGDNDHHKAEAAFKSLALALRQAITPSQADTVSTKGTLT
jgi:imidazoleglycerol phosphate dehydratase HisB